MGRSGEQSKLQVVSFDSDVNGWMLEVTEVAAQQAGWRALSYYDVRLAAEHLTDRTTHALISTLGVHNNSDNACDDFEAKPLFEIANSLQIPRLIISSHPDAPMFLRDAASDGDALTSEHRAEELGLTIVSWLGALARRAATT